MTSLREAFWVLAMGVICCFAFFFALGAFSLSDVVGVSIVVAALALAWLGHAWGVRHHDPHDRDPRLYSARERRGF
jgi:uncharacterized membrane protein YhaH (DUF805 family)